MPIEIRELHIKLNLQAEPQNGDQSAADGEDNASVKKEELMNAISDMLAKQAENCKER